MQPQPSLLQQTLSFSTHLDTILHHKRTQYSELTESITSFLIQIDQKRKHLTQLSDQIQCIIKQSTQRTNFLKQKMKKNIDAKIKSLTQANQPAFQQEERIEALKRHLHQQTQRTLCKINALKEDYEEITESDNEQQGECIQLMEGVEEELLAKIHEMRIDREEQEKKLIEKIEKCIK